MADLKENKSQNEKTSSAAPAGIKNISGRRHKIYGVMVHPGETYAPNDIDKKDQRSNQRVNNAVASGSLERV